MRLAFPVTQVLYDFQPAGENRHQAPRRLVNLLIQVQSDQASHIFHCAMPLRIQL